MSKNIMVAMSGGVDSAAAAMLMTESGNNVSGGTMIFTSGPSGTLMAEDAGKEAAFLGMEHFIYDCTEPFKKNVMDEFAYAYMEGRTPNPCVICNRYVKFPLFLENAERDGYDMMATGHYARIEYDTGSGRYLLKKGLDGAKDQSYFLYALSQIVLSRTLFPLGKLTKAEVKEMVRERGLACASRKESQDVCFLPEGDYKSFLERAYGYSSRHGNMIDMEGNVLGTHDGAAGFTPGQRRGIGVSSAGRLYVVSKDMASNTVTLGPESALYSDRVCVGEMNLIAADRITEGMRVEVKLRYSRRSGVASVFADGEKGAVLEFDEPQRAPARGQAAVMYDGDTVIGGGTVI